MSVLFTKNVRVESTMNEKFSTELKIFLRPQKRVVRIAIIRYFFIKSPIHVQLEEIKTGCYRVSNR